MKKPKYVIGLSAVLFLSACGNNKTEELTPEQKESKRYDLLLKDKL
jgi:uncharacterized lipoprotein